MVNKWLTNYFSTIISNKIRRDRKLLNQLIQGIEVDGDLCITKKSVMCNDFFDFVKMNNGMAIDYNTTCIAFYAEKLLCSSTIESKQKCISFLEERKIDFVFIHGSILIGSLNRVPPVIAGIILTEATKTLMEKS